MPMRAASRAHFFTFFKLFPVSPMSKYLITELPADVLSMKMVHKLSMASRTPYRPIWKRWLKMLRQSTENQMLSRLSRMKKLPQDKPLLLPEVSVVAAANGIVDIVNAILNMWISGTESSLSVKVPVPLMKHVFDRRMNYYDPQEEPLSVLAEECFFFVTSATVQAVRKAMTDYMSRELQEKRFLVYWDGGALYLMLHDMSWVVKKAKEQSGKVTCVSKLIPKDFMVFDIRESVRELFSKEKYGMNGICSNGLDLMSYSVMKLLSELRTATEPDVDTSYAANISMEIEVAQVGELDILDSNMVKFVEFSDNFVAMVMKHMHWENAVRRNLVHSDLEDFSENMQIVDTWSRTAVISIRQGLELQFRFKMTFYDIEHVELGRMLRVEID